jgi:pterin-4a-carbinolamine dehydratase
MAPRGEKSIFISYRRRDTLPVAMYIGDAIKRSFVNASVFIDVDVIEVGDRWPSLIRAALENASVLIVLIGPQWLTAASKDGRRRLDDPEDWVRREIELALKLRVKIIPVLFSGASLPEKKDLPGSLAPLLWRQAISLRDDTWPKDVARLVNRLHRFGFKPVEERVKYPPPGKINTHALGRKRLNAALAELTAWRVEETADPRGGFRKELVRTYAFGSFEDAVHFMSTASRRIAKFDHHPDWRNIWSTVVVRLATWDIGHRPSVHDLRLARYLEGLYCDYKPATLKG